MSAETKEKVGHTPGPWKRSGNLVLKHGRGAIAECPGHADGGVMEFIANAHLIAAAPELLEALKEIAKGEGAYSKDPLTHASNTIDHAIEVAEEAIAKAEPDA